MEQTTFSFQLTPSNPSICLGFETWVNDQCVFNTDHVKETVTVTGNLPTDDIDGEHVLKFILKNKLSEHTVIDADNNIIADALLEIDNLTFDGILLGQIVNRLTEYHHDFNGTSDLAQHKFYGTMGCNGSAELKFTTPIYLWLLENM